MNQDRHLSEIMRMAQDALVEAGAVTRCERHDGMFIHGDSAGAESVALNLASVWLERAIGSFMRADLEEAVRIVLASAGKDGCSECAKARVSSTPPRGPSHRRRAADKRAQFGGSTDSSSRAI